MLLAVGAQPHFSTIVGPVVASVVTAGTDWHLENSNLEQGSPVVTPVQSGEGISTWNGTFETKGNSSSACGHSVSPRDLEWDLECLE